MVTGAGAALLEKTLLAVAAALAVTALGVDRFRPDRYDLAGAPLLGMAVIMYAPRP